MPEIALRDYVSGGYYLALPTEREAWMPAELLPEQFVSASPDLAHFFPGSWAIQWTEDKPEERLKRAAAFGISRDEFPSVVEWATASFGGEFGWPSCFYRLDAARQARSRFLSTKPDLITLGLGLHRDLVPGFLEYAKPPAPQEGYAPMGETGVFECVSRRANVALDGEILGLEFVSTYLGMLEESWISCGMIQDCVDQRGIELNRAGLIDSYSEAAACAELVLAFKEPGVWLPWLIVKYG